MTGSELMQLLFFATVDFNGGHHGIALETEDGADLVDVLHERLVEQGRLIKEIEPDRYKKKRSKEEIGRWFKDGLRMRDQ